MAQLMCESRLGSVCYWYNIAECHTTSKRNIFRMFPHWPHWILLNPSAFTFVVQNHKRTQNTKHLTIIIIFNSDAIMCRNAVCFVKETT